MPFVRKKGVIGQVFVPGDGQEARKHPCPDCACCQWCSDARCEVCLRKQRRSCRRRRQRRGKST